MKLESFRVFIAVADAQSLVLAAKQLNKTPSGLSMALKNLETQIGAPLFASERKNQLTALGQWVLTRARHDVAQFDATVRGIHDQVQTQGQALRIGAVPSVMVHVMPSVVAAYLAAHPGSHIEIHDGDSLELQRALERDEMDLVVRSHVDAPPSPLLRERLGWVMPASHPLAGASMLEWSDVRATPGLSNRLCQQSGREWMQAFDRSAALRIHNTASLLAMVRAGLGMTLLPELAVLGLVDLAFVPCAEPEWRYLAVHTQALPSPAVQEFAAALHRYMG